MLANIDKIFHLEEAVKKAEQVELPLQEFRADGVLVRVLYIPAGTVLTGHIHNYECVSIVCKGKIIVNSGDQPIELNAGWVGISPAGIKRAGLAIENTVFISVHTDREESDLISKTKKEYIKRLNS